MKTLLIIGGTGFFGNSLLKFFSNSKFLKKKINKIIIISRKKLEKFNYIEQLKKNYKIKKINCDILKLTSLPYADYVMYAAILKNFRKDYLAVKNYTAQNIINTTTTNYRFVVSEDLSLNGRL